MIPIWDASMRTTRADLRTLRDDVRLHDDAADPRFIETVPGQGYRFAADVEAGE